MKALGDLLREHIGLDPASLGDAPLAQALRHRMETTRTTSVEDYLARAKTDPKEFTELVEEIVVPETWFFREQPAFALVTERMQQHGNRPLRILSAPCATGEEVYSLASLAHDTENAGGTRIVGIDLSQRALDAAKLGVFGSKSIRGQDPACWKSWLLPHGSEWQVADSIRSLVDFRQGNLLDPRFVESLGRFDLVFCRNLLIYLHEDARRMLTTHLDRLLEPGGLLFLGHADGVPQILETFERTGNACSFAFTRISERPAPVTPSVAPTPSKKTRPAAVQKPAVSPAPTPALPSTPALRAVMHPPAPCLDELRALADAGRLAEAEAACRNLLLSGPPDADVYHLLGVVLQAQRRMNPAEEAFRKALYLQAGHHDALMQLSLLLRARGDETGAARLLQRATRSAAAMDGGPNPR